MRNLVYIKISIAVLLIVSGIDTKAQSFVFDEDTYLKRAVEVYKNLNFSKEKVAIWRVQILATSDRREMESHLQTLNKNHTKQKFSWDFVVPFYYLKTGLFSSKEEALYLVNVYKKMGYKSATTIKEEIPTRDFLREYSFKQE